MESGLTWIFRDRLGLTQNRLILRKNGIAPLQPVSRGPKARSACRVNPAFHTESAPACVTTGSQKHRIEMTPSNLFRRAALVAVMTCLCGVACAQSADISHGANLDTPISLKLKIILIPDALKQISKQAWVKLTSLEPISDLKVTVFGKDVTAGLVLEKIASVLSCEWVHDGDLWRLHMAPEVSHARERIVLKEEELAQQDLTDEVKKLVEASGPQEAPKVGGGASRIQ